MKKTCLTLALASSAMIALPAMAQDYQMEAGLGYLSYSPDVGSSDSAIGVDFRYNFEKVSTTNRPLSEASFLGHNGGVNAKYSTWDKADANFWGVGADYWFNQIYVAANLSRADINNTNTNVFGVKAGYMINDGLRVHLGLSNKGIIEDLGVTNDERSISVGAKYVAMLGNNFVNLEGEFTHNSDFKVFNVSGDYFITNELSLGVGVAKSDLNWADKAAVDLGAKYFFLPNVSGEAAYTLNYAGVDKDDAIGVRVAARF